MVEWAARGGAPVYGINTGFGKLATVRIAPDQMRSCSVASCFRTCAASARPARSVVRLVLALKAASLARGHSGVRRRTIELLLALLATSPAGDPGQGLRRRLGDLAPLAHLAGALIGVGEERLDGAVMPAAAALDGIGERRSPSRPRRVSRS